MLRLEGEGRNQYMSQGINADISPGYSQFLYALKAIDMESEIPAQCRNVDDEVEKRIETLRKSIREMRDMVKNAKVIIRKMKRSLRKLEGKSRLRKKTKKSREEEKMDITDDKNRENGLKRDGECNPQESSLSLSSSDSFTLLPEITSLGSSSSSSSSSSLSGVVSSRIPDIVKNRMAELEKKRLERLSLKSRPSTIHIEENTDVEELEEKRPRSPPARPISPYDPLPYSSLPYSPPAPLSPPVVRDDEETLDEGRCRDTTQSYFLNPVPTPTYRCVRMLTFVEWTGGEYSFSTSLQRRRLWKYTSWSIMDKGASIIRSSYSWRIFIREEMPHLWILHFS